MYVKLTSADIKNASMITLSTAIAIFLAKWLSMSQLIWVMVIVALLPFSKIGRTAKIRHLSLIGTGIVSALAVGITVLLNSIELAGDDLAVDCLILVILLATLYSG